jgi:peptidoglycan/LPS O-acetylase OafA/YrhL
MPSARMLRHIEAQLHEPIHEVTTLLNAASLLRGNRAGRRQRPSRSVAIEFRTGTLRAGKQSGAALDRQHLFRLAFRPSVVGGMERKFYPELESLRGLAALAVVGLHASLMYASPGAGELRWILFFAFFPGNSAVVLFFVLSGFVLSNAMPHEPIQLLRHLPGYVLRRLFRILPAMWTAIAIATLALVLHGPFPNWSYEPSWSHIWRALTFTDSGLDPPLWSLVPEIYISILLMPVLVYITPRIGIAGNLLLQIAWIYHFTFHWHDVLTYVYMFHLGCLVPTVGRWVIQQLRGALFVAVFLPAIAIFAFATPALSLFGPRSFPYVQTAAVLPSFLFVSYCVVRQQSPFGALLRTRPLRLLGRVSYSLYLLHWSVRSVLAPFYSAHIPQVWPPLTVAIYVALTAAISIGLAALVYRFVEKPFIRLGHRLTEIERPVVQPPLAGWNAGGAVSHS